MTFLKHLFRISIPVFFVFLFFVGCTPKETPFFEVSYDSKLGSEGYNGRLLVLITKDTLKEPRFQINDSQETGIVVGKNVSNWLPDSKEGISASTLAYPIEDLNALEKGDYFVQALLHKYETFNLANGHTVLLPMDQGEGQHWNISPKNIYSKPIKVSIGKQNAKPIQIKLTQEIPPIVPAEDTEYIKHIKIKSKLLSEFWGRDMYLQANVLVPEGFQKESSTRYPLMVFHGHFPKTIGGFRTIPPRPLKKTPFIVVALVSQDINTYRKKKPLIFIKNGPPKIFLDF